MTTLRKESIGCDHTQCPNKYTWILSKDKNTKFKVSVEHKRIYMWSILTSLLVSYDFEILVLKPNYYCCILSYQISLWRHFYSCVDFSHYFLNQNWVSPTFGKFYILGVFNFYIHITQCSNITQFNYHGSKNKEKIEIFCFHICKPHKSNRKFYDYD